MKHLHRIGAELDARADFMNFGGALNDDDLVPPLRKTQGRTQAADPASRNRNLHGDRLRLKQQTGRARAHRMR